MSSDTYHHGHLREALLQAAQDQIAAEGYQSLNLSKLARQLNVSQPAVYRHFASKQALVFSLVAEGFMLLSQRLETAAESVSMAALPANREPSDSLIKGIEAIAQTYIDFVLEHRELARLMFSLKERATEPELYKVSKRAAATLFQWVDVGQQCYGLKVRSAEQAVRLIWATIHGLAVLLMDEQMPYVTQTPGEIAVHAAATARMLRDGLFLAAA
ncbi:MAG: TetR/AcrR family transcriptional regulator [Cyanobacteria bacterium J06555_13]